MLTRSGTARRDTDQGAVELYYEDLGDPADRPVLLIMGLGAQLPMWPDGFCAQLIDAGYRVIRFDHRDTGLSAKMHGMRADGSVYRRVWRYLLGRSSQVPYTLVDMTRDVGRAARSPRHRPGPCRRRLDGRDDRADPGRQRAGPGGVAGRGDVGHRQSVFPGCRRGG